MHVLGLYIKSYGRYTLYIKYMHNTCGTEPWCNMDKEKYDKYISIRQHKKSYDNSIQD